MIDKASYRRIYSNAYRHGAEAERQKVANWMMERSIATGHGDTVEDLLAEILHASHHLVVADGNQQGGDNDASDSAGKKDDC